MMIAGFQWLILQGTPSNHNISTWFFKLNSENRERSWSKHQLIGVMTKNCLFISLVLSEVDHLKIAFMHLTIDLLLDKRSVILLNVFQVRTYVYYSHNDKRKNKKQKEPPQINCRLRTLKDKVIVTVR